MVKPRSISIGVVESRYILYPPCVESQRSAPPPLATILIQLRRPVLAPVLAVAGGRSEVSVDVFSVVLARDIGRVMDIATAGDLVVSGEWAGNEAVLVTEEPNAPLRKVLVSFPRPRLCDEVAQEVGLEKRLHPMPHGMNGLVSAKRVVESHRAHDTTAVGRVRAPPARTGCRMFPEVALGYSVSIASPKPHLVNQTFLGQATQVVLLVDCTIVSSTVRQYRGKCVFPNQTLVDFELQIGGGGVWRGPSAAAGLPSVPSASAMSTKIIVRWRWRTRRIMPCPLLPWWRMSAGYHGWSPPSIPPPTGEGRWHAVNLSP